MSGTKIGGLTATPMNQVDTMDCVENIAPILCTVWTQWML